MGLAAATGGDGRIYAVGGYALNGSCSSLNTVTAYEPATDTWSQAIPMPTARYSLAAAAGADGRVYAIGGWQTNGRTSFTVYGTVEAYDPASGTWQTLPPTSPRYGLAAVTGPDGRIYAIGGSNGSYLGTTEAFDPSTRRWTELAPLNVPRSYLAAAVGGDGRIYAIGGSNSSDSVTTVEAYDLHSGRWTEVAPLPAPLTALAAVATSGGDIVVVGGYRIENVGAPPKGTASYQFENGAAIYSPATNSWSGLSSMASERVELAAVRAPDGRIFAIGGNRSGSVEWLRPPSRFFVGQFHRPTEGVGYPPC